MDYSVRRETTDSKVDYLWFLRKIHTPYVVTTLKLTHIVLSFFCDLIMQIDLNSIDHCFWAVFSAVYQGHQALNI